jgi:hypothetical protein
LADVVKGNPSGPPALATALRFLSFAFTKLLKKALTLKGIRTSVRPFFLRSSFLLCFDPLENSPRDL